MDENINLAIRAMLIDLIDQIMKRPLYKVVLEDGQKNPFDSTKKELESNTPITLNQFLSPIKNFFDETKSKDIKYVSDSAIVLEKFFEKRFNLICLFSNYRFKDILLETAKKTFPDVESFTQVSEDNKKESESFSIPHRGKKSTKSVRIIQNNRSESDADDEYTDKNDDNYGE